MERFPFPQSTATQSRMPQRRKVVHNNNDETDETQILVEHLDLETAATSNTTSNNTQSPDTDPDHREVLWKNSPFAIGLTNATWIEERNARLNNHDNDAVCLCASGWVCGWLGATRLGNMSVLKSSTNERTGETQLEIVVGPYWPMLVGVTYPLIFGVSGWTYYSGILHQNKPLLLILVWFLLTTTLIVALALTSFRDPGILRRLPEPPEDDNTGTQQPYRWCDPALTYRPRDAWFDTDTAVVVEQFDHTCPWTGTAIGKKNMLAFQVFVCMVFVTMIFDIFLLTGAL